MLIDYQSLLENLSKEVLSITDDGVVAHYIPELASISPDKFGVHLCTIDGLKYGVGDNEEKFSVQSIVKVLSLTLAFQQMGESLWNRVGVEPSGSAFNSLWQLEYEKGIPRNPLINSGAIVICDILCTLYPDPWKSFLEFLHNISGDPSIDCNEAVATSESRLGFRNAALINMMASCGNIHNPIDRVLDLYYKQCAIEMSCKELA